MLFFDKRANNSSDNVSIFQEGRVKVLCDSRYKKSVKQRLCVQCVMCVVRHECKSIKALRPSGQRKQARAHLVLSFGNII